MSLKCHNATHQVSQPRTMTISLFYTIKNPNIDLQDCKLHATVNFYQEPSTGFIV